MDSLKTIKQVPESIRIEGPIGAMEVDTGNPYADGFMVICVLMFLYIGKRLVDRFLQ